MKVGIPNEIHPGERRVAATPDTAQRLQKMGFEVCVESGAGESANYTDESYAKAGCTVIADTRELWSSVDLILKVREPEVNTTLGCHEAELLDEGQMLVSYLWPAQNGELVKRLQARKVTALAMDAIPRITRAQKMDALSSMANISGYRAIVEAAQQFGGFFTGQITAAGKIPPAKVLVIGAGVAGLAAIGASRGMGASVRAFDTRAAVKEQVESMGAEFITVDIEEDGAGTGGYGKVMSDAFLEAERRLFEEQALEVDIIVTTALIPGKPAPELLTEKVCENLRDGSVIVDLASEQGGNCVLTKPGEVHEAHGVKIIGYKDLPSRMANVASRLYGTNLCHLLDDLGGAENFKLEEGDEVVRGALILNQGELRWPPKAPPAEAPAPAPAKPEKKAAEKKVAAAPAEPAPKKKERETKNPVLILAASLCLFAAGWVGDSSLMSHVTVFVLACFVGWQVVWNVTAALHTPLMSVTNAISGIIVIGGMLQLGGDIGDPAVILGAIAVLLATINIAGGFLVTKRMLSMFHK